MRPFWTFRLFLVTAGALALAGSGCGRSGTTGLRDGAAGPDAPASTGGISVGSGGSGGSQSSADTGSGGSISAGGGTATSGAGGSGGTATGAAGGIASGGAGSIASGGAGTVGGSGGTASGGAGGTATGGGTIATGGSTATGGTTASGGSTATGGITASGGSTATGGTAAGGGTTGTGGTPRSGGSVSTGGAGGAATGGSSAGDAGDCIDVCGLYGSPCCVFSGACIQPGGSCVVEVLSANMSSPSYEYASLEKQIASLPQDLLVSFTDADIDWAAADPPPTSRIEMHMTAQASSLYGAALETPYPTHPFRVSCGGQSLFVGVIYYIGGAAALNVPVLAVSRDADNLVVLRLGAWQGAWYMGSYLGPTGARERIDRPELRAVFCQRGVLRAFP